MAMRSIYDRFAQGVVQLTAGVIDLLAVFDIIDWSQDQLASVNLVALLVWSIIFGQQVNSLREGSG